MQVGGGEVRGLSGTAGYQFDLPGGPREAKEPSRTVTLGLILNT